MVDNERFEKIKQSPPYPDWRDWVEPKLVSAGLKVQIGFDPESCLGLYQVENMKTFIHPQYHDLSPETLSIIGVPLNGLIGELEPQVAFFKDGLIKSDKRVMAISVAFTLAHKEILERLLNHFADSEEIPSLEQFKEMYRVTSALFFQKDFNLEAWLNQISK